MVFFDVLTCKSLFGTLVGLIHSIFKSFSKASYSEEKQEGITFAYFKLDNERVLLAFL